MQLFFQVFHQHKSSRDTYAHGQKAFALSCLFKDVQQQVQLEKPHVLRPSGQQEGVRWDRRKLLDSNINGLKNQSESYI